MRKILFILGTRPEAIKLCPVILHFRQLFEVKTCVTAQHRSLLDQVLAAFGLKPDIDLDLMLPGQTLFQSTSRILASLEGVLQTEKPGMIFVQGDTTTTFCGALAGFYAGVPVAHVEAGLRTGDMRQPFPEEMNRVLATRLAALHFPPTRSAADNLRREGIPESSIHITGNTGIDALLYVKAGLESGRMSAPDALPFDNRRKMILVTGHRRESFGEGFERICEALSLLAGREDVEIVYPVHPNPRVTGPVRRLLGKKPRIHLIEPQEYVPFVDLMRRCHFLLTDSGGVQEEAPSLGKPVLVMRDKTERPEAVEAGSSRLVGTDPERILAEARLLLEDEAEYERRSRIHNPYGDGRASGRIARAVQNYFAAAREMATAPR
ncbi:MAG: UDP-N-acetylglucosamine 2-epimerase (non-hydrolyzing) [Bryobacterales bacterium]|nr:UDP-N-acetylglucosamine 2-epimerase (non-hydrolyzing) [Bryobacterales bacterium]